MLSRVSGSMGREGVKRVTIKHRFIKSYGGVEV
jgi:hypothetical protein